jgi:hypothetical protein
MYFDFEVFDDNTYITDKEIFFQKISLNLELLR